MSICALCAALLAFPRMATADGDYFSDGNKQLTFLEEGERSSTDRIVLLSLFGSGLLFGAIGTYYALDSRSLSNEVSASGTHTGKAWSSDLENTRKDALRSRTVARVTLGFAGGLALAGMVTYIITAPDMEVGYQDWQTRSFAIPSKGGAVVGQRWTF